MPLTTFFGNVIIDHMLRNQSYTPPSTIYVSLHTAQPNDTGSNEVSGGSYARQAMTLNVASNKSTANSSNIDFTNMPATNVLWAGIWDASTGGSFLMSGSLTGSKVVNSGDTFRFQSGDFVIVFN